MSIPDDIVRRVERDFPSDSGTVLSRLHAARRDDRRLFSDRILRCIVFASRGEASRVAPLLELAQKDYRDLIVTAECDDQWKTIRDLNQPFEL